MVIALGDLVSGYCTVVQTNIGAPKKIFLAYFNIVIAKVVSLYRLKWKFISYRLKERERVPTIPFAIDGRVITIRGAIQKRSNELINKFCY